MVESPAGSSRTDAFDHSGIADGHGIRRDRFHNDGARPNDAIWADVGHHDGAVADPAVVADLYLRKLPTLVLDRPVGAVDPVLSPAAEDVHVTADRGVTADHGAADGAAVADHDAGGDRDLRVRQRGPEPDMAVGR